MRTVTDFWGPCPATGGSPTPGRARTQVGLAPQAQEGVRWTGTWVSYGKPSGSARLGHWSCKRCLGKLQGAEGLLTQTLMEEAVPSAADLNLKRPSQGCQSAQLWPLRTRHPGISQGPVWAVSQPGNLLGASSDDLFPVPGRGREAVGLAVHATQTGLCALWPVGGVAVCAGSACRTPTLAVFVMPRSRAAWRLGGPGAGSNCGMVGAGMGHRWPEHTPMMGDSRLG